MGRDIKKQKYTCSFACLTCRKTFKRGVSFPRSTKDEQKKCPHCEGNAYNLGRNFRSPKISDEKSWKLVEFLIQNGFLFQNIYDPQQRPKLKKVAYPKTIEEAQIFVAQYKEQSIYIQK